MTKAKAEANAKANPRVTAKSFEWPQGSQREILEWINEHKGHESELIMDEKEALRHLRNSLEGTHGGVKKYDFGRKQLSMAEVRRKIDSLWADRLAKFQSDRIRIFYEEGSAVLDWEKLSAYISGEYTADEIQSYKDAAADAEEDLFESSDSSPSSDADEQPKSSKIAKHPKEQEDAADADDQDSPETRSKRPRLEGTFSNRANGGSQQSSANQGSYVAPRTNVDPYSQGSPSYAGTPYWAKLQRTASGNMNPLPIEPLPNAKEGDPPYYLNSSRWLADMINTDPPEMIEDVMTDIKSSIHSLVMTYMEDSGVPDKQPAIIDEDLRFPKQCAVLLFKVLGYSADHDIEHRSWRLSTFHQTKVRLMHFLESFVACAVTMRALESDVDERTYYESLSDGEVRRTFEKAFGLSLQGEMRQRLWREHLICTVIPKIEGESHRMASTLETYVSLFILKNNIISGASHEERVTRSRHLSTKPTHNDAGPELLKFKFYEPKACVNFRIHAAHIFSDVLKWRARTSLGLDVQYEFEWPSFLDDYETDRMETPTKGPATDQPELPRVLLAEMPVVSRSFRQTREVEDWGEYEVVRNGVIWRM